MDDLISRQKAIDALAKHEKSNGHNYTLFVDIVSECAEIIRDIPPAEPKTGKWLEKEVIHADEAKEVIEEWQSCKCSECGRYDTRPYMYYFSEPRYCSWCGMKMKGKR